MPPRKKPPTLLKLAFKALGELISVICKDITDKSFLLLVANSDKNAFVYGGQSRLTRYIDRRIEDLRNSLFSTISWDNHDNLCSAIIQTITEAVISSKGFEDIHEEVHHVQVAFRLCKLIGHPSVRKLNLAKLPKGFRHEIYKHLQLFSGVEELNFGSGSGDMSRDLAFQSLQNLRNLKSLTLQFDCNDRIIELLATSCPSLRHLDVSMSSMVTFQSAKLLSSCKGLTQLNLYQTKIGNAGYIEILKSLPKLLSVGRYDHLGTVLTLIYEDIEQNSKKGDLLISLPLQSITSRDASKVELQVASKLCPQLAHIDLFLDESQGMVLSPLLNMINLTELKLATCCFYTNGIDKVLRGIGNQLSVLHLEHVDQMDMEALCTIANNSLSMRSLTLFSCDFTENFGESRSKKKLSHGAFDKLEKLNCISETAPNVIEFLLTQAKHLKSIRFGSTSWFNDNLIVKIIRNGGLAHLEEITILKSYELTSITIELLLESCPNLRALTDIECWEGASKEYIANLRARIQKENLDLNTCMS